MKDISVHILIVLNMITGMVACSSKAERRNFAGIPFAEGDIVFRKGMGMKSQAVIRVDSLGLFSHSGIVVRVDSCFKIVHITPDERQNGETEDIIKMELPETFWGTDKAQRGAVYRLTDNDSAPHTAAHHALRLLHKGIVFDHDYDLTDSTKLYCTELIWYVYWLAGTDISSGKRSLLKNMPMSSGTYILPSDIYTNSELNLIFHF
ncbi:MAG: hypothetical protein LBR49_01920 [Tannerella sp.]|nr:hypothetical protein [Tannerella sp.]